jgi:hypothetical protein
VGVDHDRSCDLELHPFGCMGGEIFEGRSMGFIPVEMVRNSSPNSLVARNHQNQCYAHAWGRCADYHCNGVLWLHLVLILPSTAQACGNAGSLTCQILQTVHRALALF